MTTQPTALILNEGQEAALRKIQGFLVDPMSPTLLLSGYAGCGKSTLVKTLLANMDTYMKMARLINPEMPAYELMLTATTNKACEALAGITGQEVKTIHSALGLRLEYDFTAAKSVLVDDGAKTLYEKIIVIDEASYVDSKLLQFITDYTQACKIIFVGDKGQLTAVGCNFAPVFVAGFPEAALTEVVRQAAGNPIIEMATGLRNWVMTGEKPRFKLDHHHITHLDRAAFDAAIVKEFTRANWTYNDSKVLAWTNKAVIRFNSFIRQHAKGDPNFQIGDYATCNDYIKANGRSFKTDQLVLISRIEPGQSLGVAGKWFTIDGTAVFMPNSLTDKKARFNEAKADRDSTAMLEIEERWADLRAVYAQTVNKSQGSTYDRVFIDLDDIGRCHNKNQVARMLYVGVSRARHNVIFTGDLRK